ncbi:discoidin domain-containing protein [Haloferula sp.]|uniref:discoidin domain-containing protein n=1 Tax=Haloferula sp. TaxID=2497595 RepID=UPI003C72A284
MKEDSLDHLIQKLLDGELDQTTREELNRQLLASAEHRERYRSALRVHSALLRRDEGSIPAFVTHRSQTLHSAKKSRFIPYSIAALILLSLAILSADFLSEKSRQPKAEVLSITGVTWPSGARELGLGRLPSKTSVELLSGILEVGYPSGARAVLEGPCRFSLDHKEALTVFHGRASVHAPEGAEGFRLDTPAGAFIDRGTEFGIAVGNDGSQPVVLTEVFEGEIEISTRDPDGVQQETRLLGGESRAVTRNGEFLSELDESPVHLANGLRRTDAASASSMDNLALGKPVMSPGYCTRPHGSVFPPDNLTDGRLDDSGVPGDWSFWLAPDGESGEFTVDLLGVETVSRISLQNTGNRSINDRGIDSFILMGSLDNQNFFHLTEGSLPRIDPSLYGQSYPFVDFTFKPAEVRYIKCVVASHFRHPERPVDHECQGGGLNEIRIFAK